MKRIALFLLLIVGFASVGFTLYDRFHTGARTRISICQEINTVKKILRDEHEKKLLRAEKFLHDNPNGSGGITVTLILESIQDEKTVIAAVQPERCI